MDVSTIFGLLMMALYSNKIECASFGRYKRFLLYNDQGAIVQQVPYPVPTTIYPVPTIHTDTNPILTPPTKTTPLRGAIPTVAPHLSGSGPPGNGNGLLSAVSGSALLSSASINCPRKRSADTRRITLDERLMEELYLKLIGNIDTTRMARSHDEALDNFLIPESMNKNYQHESRQKRSSTRLTMKSVKSDIEKFQGWFDAMSVKYIANRTTKANTTGVARDTYSTIYSQLTEILEKIQITMDQLKLVLGLTNNLEDIIGLRLKSPQRQKRSGSQHTIAFCSVRGNQTADGYLHMCASCAGTTQLPDDIFPRFVNENECDARDCDCFKVRGTPYGKCSQKTHSMKLLKKKDRGCRVLLHDGQKYILDDWEVVDYDINVACECLFSKNTLYSQFIYDN